ncbi:bifunctional riboflavin kinase/FAD synthetase [Rubrolithibacter danxiaensis]|uniref:bifunctional riboflavin kinase/FAD synthetase n=1 Tax=Rubrolithibacter danxiaensis TaxID=3390805 RepID=UPI003BF7D0AC
MKVYKNLAEFDKRNSVVTIGTFDGVHIGHRKIISRLLEVAEQRGGETVILTFFPHPRMIIHPEDVNLKLITTIDEKAELLEDLGIDHLIITPFTRDFSNLAPEEYIKQILVEQIGTQQIVIGYDHRFGKNREGGLTDLLRLAPQYNFEVEEIPEQDIHDVAVSSTKIREALLKGDVRTAKDFLGYHFHITGKVIRGDQIGRKLGFPTANLLIAETYKILPADGIYAVRVEADKTLFNGMAYLGSRPTLNGMSRNIEANIFNFDQDLYGKDIRLHFIEFIRGDARFDTLEDLRRQIEKDQDTASLILQNKDF